MDKRALPSVKKNYILNILLTVSSILFPLITFPWVSRILQPAGMGKVTFATSFVAYFGIIAKMGIPTYGVRACARVRNDREELSRVAQELLTINLGMSIVAYAGLAGSMLLVPRVREDWQLFAIIGTTILLDAVGMEWLYGALEQYTYITIRSLIFKVIALGATFLLVRQPDDILIYGGITIFATSASNILNLINAHRFITFRRVGGYNFRRHWKAIAIFFAMACATTVYTNLDAIMLGFMKTDADVGYYNAAVKVKKVLVGVVTALGTVLLPRLSYYIERGETENFRTTTRKALRFEILAAVPVAVYFMLFARDAVLLLSGPAYLEAVLPMQIIMPTVLLIGLTNVLGIQMLVPLGREKTVLYSVVLGAVVDLLLNAILIPLYGAAGAAAGTLAAEAAVLAVQYRALRENVRDAFRSFPWGWLAIGVILSSGAGIWVRFTGLGTLPGMIVSAVCFFGVYIGFLLWRKEEIVCDALNSIGRFVRGKRNPEKQEHH